MAKRLKKDKKIPAVLASLPKEVYEQIVYWSHNTFLNETHIVDIKGYSMHIRPIIGSDYEEYSVVRVRHADTWLYQGWVKMSILK